MSIQFGGKTIYGATLGIMMLDTKFPRVHGDMGNAATWPFPVQYRVVRGASPDKVVRQNPLELTDAFIDAAKDLVASGCDGLTTNCGFLALVQQEIAAAVPVPVATSSLMQIPMVQKMLPPGRRVGVLTISADKLTSAHLLAAGVTDPAGVPIVGTDGGNEFTSGILEDHEEIDFEACRQDMIAAAHDLTRNYENIGGIVLECTNMVPYAADVRKATGLPVFSIYNFVTWFQQALLPDHFDLIVEDPRRS